jgi:hypothetical protein
MKNLIKGYTKRFLNKSRSQESKTAFTVIDKDVKFVINNKEFYLLQMLEEIDEKLNQVAIVKWAGIVISVALAVPAAITLNNYMAMRDYANTQLIKLKEQDVKLKEQDAELRDLRIDIEVLKVFVEKSNK